MAVTGRTTDAGRGGRLSAQDGRRKRPAGAGRDMKPWASGASAQESVLSLQRLAGNQAVSRLLIPTSSPGPGRAGPFGPLWAAGGWTTIQRDDDKSKQPPEDPAVTAIREWAKTSPTTNVGLAQFVQEADRNGFVDWTDPQGHSKDQVDELAKGNKVESADPKKDQLIGGLKVLHELILAKVNRWVQHPSEPKEKTAIGSFLRHDAGHGSGVSIDINDLDWTGQKGPAQVIDLLSALTAGHYGIGLPFQGAFFPRDRWLQVLKANAEAEAKAKGKATPDPITKPSLEKWKSPLYTAAWVETDDQTGQAGTKKGAWQTTEADGTALELLGTGTVKDTTLRDDIRDLNKNGFHIYVFPDNDNHIHIQNV